MSSSNLSITISILGEEFLFLFLWSAAICIKFAIGKIKNKKAVSRKRLLLLFSYIFIFVYTSILIYVRHNSRRYKLFLTTFFRFAHPTSLSLSLSILLLFLPYASLTRKVSRQSCQNAPFAFELGLGVGISGGPASYSMLNELWIVHVGTCVCVCAYYFTFDLGLLHLLMLISCN